MDVEKRPHREKIKTKEDGVGDKIKMIIHQSEVVPRDFFRDKGQLDLNTD
ncbi:hypothetical protein O163_05020 [Caldanaerobacter subterraneus subsp. yonseiensis KB-1]|uniref:Uncharacterized protein n=1 Tax=Caldanaerobacter subterraneus subsp. yonseiensis KB-1 TaxID=1388761 RepID=U5CUB3_CALSX|nr:hypothetical protein [Caldanaerobacter subterraneus]ERM92526.1 hypothetical protein O163_05020 [Caldanaerobacter subterraneus subsp. yonseiensis KB-1]